MTPLVIALKKMNTDPSEWSVPKKGSYKYDHLMKLMNENKPTKRITNRREEDENERALRIIREAEEAIGIYRK